MNNAAAENFFPNYIFAEIKILVILIRNKLKKNNFSENKRKR